jgi:hypothetical protein
MKAQQPDYRGISQTAVIASLKKAEAFVTGLNIGPETAKEIAAWATPATYDRLAASGTRTELARAMAETGAANGLLRLQEVLELHALADRRARGARPLYRALSSWGAFHGMLTAAYTPMNEEMDRHIVQTLSTMTKGPQAQTMLAAVMHELAKAEAALPATASAERSQVRDLLKMGGRVGTLLARGDDPVAFFRAGSLRERHLFIQILHAISGTEQERKELKALGPFARYGVPLAEGKGHSFAKLQEMAEPIMGPVGKALEPYYETDEVGMTGVGGITADFNKLGLIIDMTRPAALAVMAALPAGYELVDSKGKPVRPAAPKPPRPPAP